SAGDGMHVASVTRPDLGGGCPGVTRAGVIEENAELCVPARKTELQTKRGHTRRSMHNELKDVAKLLGCPSAIDDQPSQDSVRYPGLSISVYEDAVETYRRSFQSVV